MLASLAHQVQEPECNARSSGYAGTRRIHRLVQLVAAEGERPGKLPKGQRPSSAEVDKGRVRLHRECYQHWSALGFARERGEELQHDNAAGLRGPPRGVPEGPALVADGAVEDAPRGSPELQRGARRVRRPADPPRHERLGARSVARHQRIDARRRGAAELLQRLALGPVPAFERERRGRPAPARRYDCGRGAHVAAAAHPRLGKVRPE